MNYTDQYKAAQIKPGKLAELQAAVKKIMAGKDRYDSLAANIGNGIPWWFIGITHFMEAGGKKDPFQFHLHCGDPLSARTVHVPAGRPKFNPGHGDDPPSESNMYTWEESATDALSFAGYDKVTDWSIGNCLDLFERYNGLGYRKKGVPSPYLWSYTDQYSAGKYVGDGHYDPTAISQQPGTAAIMKVLGI